MDIRDQILDMLMLICDNDADQGFYRYLDRRKKLALSDVEIQKDMDCLRLVVLYMVFDLEACRREIAELKDDFGINDPRR